MTCELIEDNNNWSAIQSLFKEQAIKKGFPHQVVFELTPICNFKCNMCYIRLDKDQVDRIIPAKQWISWGSELAELGSINMTLTGGEAMMHPQFEEIYDALYHMGFLIKLRTNGFLLQGKRLEWLLNRKPLEVVITLYGSSDDTYEKVCGISNGFTTVSKNIDQLLSNHIPVILSMTATLDNQADIDEVIQFSKDRNIKLRLTRKLLDPFENTKRSVKNLRIPIQADDVEDKLNTESVTKNPRTLAFGRCANFGVQCSFTWQGKLTACTGVPSIYEELENTTVKEAFQKLNTTLNNIYRPSECESCKYFNYCRACPSDFYGIGNGVDFCTYDIKMEAKMLYERIRQLEESEINNES